MIKKITLLATLSVAFFFHSCKSTPEVKTGIQVGEKLPIITLNSLEGKKISTDDFKGNYLFIDFWASWCKPCRKANVELKKMYPKYQNKDFKILQISFDGDIKEATKNDHKAKWKKAIQEDQLNFSSHASDLIGWNSPLIEKYQIDYIPYSYLLDKNGVILAKDLEVEQLESFLKKTIK